MKNQIKELLQISDVSYYRWRKQRKIFNLLEKYFTQQDLKDFLSKKGEIKKQELIKDLDVDELEYLIKNKIERFSSDERLKELIRFFSISNLQKLATALAASLRNNGQDSGRAKCLDNIPSMQQFINILENIMDDKIVELKKDTVDHVFESTLSDFNDKVSFDFSEEDKVIISHILDRYRVYNTLYNLEKTSIVS